VGSAGLPGNFGDVMGYSDAPAYPDDIRMTYLVKIDRKIRRQMDHGGQHRQEFPDGTPRGSDQV